MRLPFLKKSILLLCLILLCTPSVFALDVQRFNPTTDQYETFANMGSSTLKPGAFHIALFYNHVDDPLEFNIVGVDSQVGKIVGNFNTLNFTPAVGIFDWLSISASIPFNLMTSVRNDIPNFSQKEDYSFGDAQIFLKFRLLDNQKNLLGLALIPHAQIPMDTSIQDQFNDSSYSFGGRLALDAWLGQNNYVAVNIGGSYRLEDENLQTLLQTSHDLDYGLSYTHHFSDNKRFDLFTELTGRTELTEPFQSGQKSPLEALLGMRYRFLDNKITTFLGGGRGITNGYSTPDFRVFAGIQYSQRKDQEPKKPEPVVEEKPKEIPDIGQIFIQVFDEERQPLLADILLRDQNGDLVARATDVQLKKNLKPADYDIYVEKPGYTYVQKTITLNKGKRAKQGVILGKIKKEGQKIEYLGKILFNFNQASLQDASFTILDHVVDVLQRHEEVKLIRVEAHTDSKGSELYNLNLSKDRAKSVLDYIVAAGIDPSRLSSIGLGESQPIDTNETEEGRANNRRVEFTILKSDNNVVRSKR